MVLQRLRSFVTPLIMSTAAPQLVAISHDDYHARHIGRLPDGRQFFLTTPFVPAFPKGQGAEYIALYFFDEIGKFLGSRIESLGPRASLDRARAQAIYQTWLEELIGAEFGRIEVSPFAVEQDGIQFGLIPREPEDEEDVWAVEMQPGNYMAFFEPWDSGDYDT